MFCLRLLFFFSTLNLSLSVSADVIRVAVASNFVFTFKKIAKEFELKTGHKINISSGSTGKHFAQIINGAPFDLFFAADLKRPELLEKRGRVIGKGRFTYAQGKLILWSTKSNLKNINKVLLDDKLRFVAIANPKLAPYGYASKEFLKSQDLWKKLKGRVVYGENIGQTYNFVRSGNARVGFIALSQYKKRKEGSFWRVPESFYSAIEQQVVLLSDNKAALAFLNYFKTTRVKNIITMDGYGVIDAK
jgi:molybdate transport system substrate-binding protein